MIQFDQILIVPPGLQFFRQGDVELRMGLPLSPLFDRTKEGVTKSQVGFFDIVGEWRRRQSRVSAGSTGFRMMYWWA
jgi:hypothetical protein